MFSPTIVILVVSLYMGLLFFVAQTTERRCKMSGNTGTHPVVYVLSITVFCTSWTFYGSVGFAASSGFLYFAIYVGAIVGILLWWRTLRRIVHVKESYHISSIADFISARYNRSQAVAALVTLISLLGVVPYIALQLKAIVSTFAIISTHDNNDLDWEFSGILITLFMILFTVIFGARRLDPTQRHQGVMAALAVECLIKLAAFLAVGIFVTYSLFEGFGDIIQLINDAGLNRLLGPGNNQGSTFIQWATLVILGAAAIQCLPRQFHVAVIENSDERHIRIAMWLVPLYLILINLFVIPIAAGGLLSGLPETSADSFVLLLPLHDNQPALSLFVFIGGFSAASGMTIISAMTLSTMATNHLLLPAIEFAPRLGFLRHHLLQCRWMVITLILISSYWFAREFSDSYMLVAMGMISFVAVFQFAPALLGGLIWHRGNQMGAMLGLAAGLLCWLYTLVIPTFVNHGWLELRLLTEGPWGIAWLRPQALLGLDGLPPVAHSVFWSFLFNAGFYVAGSILHSPLKIERTQLTEFLRALDEPSTRPAARPTGLDSYIDFEGKFKEASQLLNHYLPTEKTAFEIQCIATDLQVRDKEQITIIELVEFHRMLERVLAGSIGAASAHKAIQNRIRYSDRETTDLKAVYSHILSELHGQPHISAGNKQQTDQRSGQGHSFLGELQTQIDDQSLRNTELNKEIEKLKNKLGHYDDQLFDERLLNQKLTQENRALQQRLEARTKA
jgi:Na+/proline symporter